MTDGVGQCDVGIFGDGGRDNHALAETPGSALDHPQIDTVRRQVGLLVEFVEMHELEQPRKRIQMRRVDDMDERLAPERHPVDEFQTRTLGGADDHGSHRVPRAAIVIMDGNAIDRAHARSPRDVVERVDADGFDHRAQRRDVMRKQALTRHSIRPVQKQASVTPAYYTVALLPCRKVERIFL